ncbi:MAG: hypothetical protein HYR55_14405 [Acidobacteria bacterium]|nr:hypothetical protein [Acidobacteriota bacterium]MBI3657465.1 hypothetical protein [Acidobacteriota bacterium]
MIEFKRVILIDKATDDLIIPRSGTPATDVNLKSLTDNLTEESGESSQRFTFHRSYSYREVMGSLLHSPYTPSLVVDRFCLAEKDSMVELTLRAACKSVASVTSLPWITAERWDTAAQKWHFIQETGELLNTTALIGRMEEAILAGEQLLSNNDVLGGNISGLELLALLQSLAASFPYNYCYVHNMSGNIRACLYSHNHRLVHAVFYDQKACLLAQGQSALDNFIKTILKAIAEKSKGRQQNFAFRFMAQPKAPHWLPQTMQLTPDEAFIKAIAAIETSLSHS